MSSQWTGSSTVRYRAYAMCYNSCPLPDMSRFATGLCSAPLGDAARTLFTDAPGRSPAAAACRRGLPDAAAPPAGAVPPGRVAYACRSNVARRVGPGGASQPDTMRRADEGDPAHGRRSVWTSHSVATARAHGNMRTPARRSSADGSRVLLLAAYASAQAQHVHSMRSSPNEPFATC